MKSALSPTLFMSALAFSGPQKTPLPFELRTQPLKVSSLGLAVLVQNEDNKKVLGTATRLCTQDIPPNLLKKDRTYFITASHVIEDVRKISLSESSVVFPARVEQASSLRDLALISTNQMSPSENCLPLAPRLQLGRMFDARAAWNLPRTPLHIEGAELSKNQTFSIQSWQLTSVIGADWANALPGRDLAGPLGSFLFGAGHPGISGGAIAASLVPPQFYFQDVRAQKKHSSITLEGTGPLSDLNSQQFLIGIFVGVDAQGEVSAFIPSPLIRRWLMSSKSDPLDSPDFVRNIRGGYTYPKLGLTHFRSSILDAGFGDLADSGFGDLADAHRKDSLQRTKAGLWDGSRLWTMLKNDEEWHESTPFSESWLKRLSQSKKDWNGLYHDQKGWWEMGRILDHFQWIPHDLFNSTAGIDSMSQCRVSNLFSSAKIIPGFYCLVHNDHQTEITLYFSPNLSQLPETVAFRLRIEQSDSPSNTKENPSSPKALKLTALRYGAGLPKFKNPSRDLSTWPASEKSETAKLVARLAQGNSPSAVLRSESPRRASDGDSSILIHGSGNIDVRLKDTSGNWHEFVGPAEPDAKKAFFYELESVLSTQ